MEVCTNANYTEPLIERRFTSGYCMLLGSKKPKCCEVKSGTEFQALVQGICELLMKIILDDFNKIWSRYVTSQSWVFHTTRFNVIQIEHGDKLALYQGGAGSLGDFLHSGFGKLGMNDRYSFPNLREDIIISMINSKFSLLFLLFCTDFFPL